MKTTNILQAHCHVTSCSCDYGNFYFTRSGVTYVASWFLWENDGEWVFARETIDPSFSLEVYGQELYAVRLGDPDIYQVDF